jgi:glucose dehydrogenase
MLMRPVARVGRRGVVGMAARTAVVAGTATAVAGGVAHHQAAKQEQRDEAAAYEQQQQQEQQAPQQQAYAAPQQAYAPAPAVSDDTVAQLERLGKLKQEGILTDEEFAAQKAKLLGT